MTLSEFKAWFEGFTEVMDGPPNKKQWERIQARVKEIDGTAITKTVYLDRYVYPNRAHLPYWYQQTYGYGMQLQNMAIGPVGNAAIAQAVNTARAPQKSDFDAYSAMLDLGRAEYSSSPGRSIS